MQGAPAVVTVRLVLLTAGKPEPARALKTFRACSRMYIRTEIGARMLSLHPCGLKTVDPACAAAWMVERACEREKQSACQAAGALRD